MVWNKAHSIPEVCLYTPTPEFIHWARFSQKDVTECDTCTNSKRGRHVSLLISLLCLGCESLPGLVCWSRTQVGQPHSPPLAFLLRPLQISQPATSCQK